jgi:aminoglycoside 3-N-acetyltransferase
MRISKETLSFDLGKIGIAEGDLLFVTANLGAIGYAAKNRSQTINDIVEVILHAVGESGTVVAASYTDSFFRLQPDKEVIFSHNSASNSGPLSNAFLQNPRSVRSMHPTNSYVGIGPLAEKILRDHDSADMSYTPIGKMVSLGAKNLMLGTIDKTNAPMCFHYAQEQLGITRRSPYAGWFQTYHKREDDSIVIFTRNDAGGCSRGAHNLYGKLLTAGAMRMGYVGKANCALIDGQSSLKIIRDAIKLQSKISSCEDKLCTSCYGNFSTVGFSAIGFWIMKIARILLMRTMHGRVL